MSTDVKKDEKFKKLFKELEESEFFKQRGVSFFSGEEIGIVQIQVPDADFSTLLLDSEPKPGEGTKVAVVKDSKGIEHRISLRPN